ncbi:uncharacterized protein L969DRAFT_50016 [Mixia osmundae IAM 14324]|uniref:Large ribosomal subunit protein uL15/eL18 domain-containing protein n=1 Tax=Mixia osmundae (strain CBS 9802 / IAM 14324 / JCM 22182 / KY 12970) TaxID=764103 RepID=G7DYZ5_MIXOS|nr:uncharacterized protein L969DRAFT_50016 [Mixia osmundae IAM 14324]KEI38636.1 hypothetical protein L969DRAFT_50016 [Mixia osmundae IAM 14324]GAA95805.1 hypothetical protein E5Q_02462 [Mixia osmundae IAM 14324]
MSWRGLARLAIASTSRLPSSSSSSAPAVATCSPPRRPLDRLPSGLPGPCQSRSYATPASNHLAALAPVKGATKNRKRVGRGPGSGRGKTATKGHKGQNARGGVPRRGFTGGQTPLSRTVPKRGFTPPTSEPNTVLPLNRLHQWILTGRIDPTRPITMRELLESGCVHKVEQGGVKLLSDAVGDPGHSVPLPPIEIYVSRASKTAIKRVEDAGGKIQAVYHNRLGLRALLKPHRFEAKGLALPRQALPTTKKDLDYYTDPAKRGYLAGKSIQGYERPAPSIRPFAYAGTASA